MLGILAAVTELGIKHTDLRGRLRSVNAWGFISGQWLLLATILMEIVAPPLLVTACLWGGLLAVAIGLVAWGTITTD